MVEVRAFAHLKELFVARGWAYPLRLTLDEPCTALELAQQLDLPVDRIASVFINGLATSIETGLVKPGDRIGFVPYGTAGQSKILGWD